MTLGGGAEVKVTCLRKEATTQTSPTDVRMREKRNTIRSTTELNDLHRTSKHENNSNKEKIVLE